MLLIFLLCIPLLTTVILFLMPVQHSTWVRRTSLFSSFLSFFCSLFLWVGFQPLTLKYQYYFSVSYSHLNYCLSFGMDGLSLFFIILTSFLFVLCVLYNWSNITFSIKEYFIILFLIEFFLFLIFLSLDLFFFYFFFESILIPMFVLIGFWGSRAKKIKAAYLLFFYTLLSSIPFLVGIIYLFLTYGYTSFPLLGLIKFSTNEQLVLWLLFFFSFASKVPMVPFHIWLPEAHVEAPTTGSVLLAGILLKLGIYGFLRFLIPLFPEACSYFLPLVFTLSIIGIIYPALTAIRQTDLKRIIAYSSISHMNLVVLGVFSGSLSGTQGAVLQCISHGLVASGLFFLVGFIYDRYHTRIIKYYGGLVQIIPIFSFFFLFFMLSNIAIPGTSNFIGEFIILLNLFYVSKFITVLGATGMILGGIYSLWLTNKILYGNVKNRFLLSFSDLNEREFFIISVLAVLIILLGLFPSVILKYLFF